METKQCIETRRSIRKFSPRPIERATVEELVRMAQLAPSWKNSQTTRFTAVTDSEMLSKISNSLGDWNKPIVASSPLLMAVSAVTKRSGYERDGSPTTKFGEGYTFFDCGASVENFCLAAHDKGIGTVILGLFDPELMKLMLNIPKNEEVLVLIACGHPDGESSIPKRRDLENVLRFI